MIDGYNSGSRNVEIFFADLVEFAQKLNIEDKRAISENWAEEELAIFEWLTNQILPQPRKKNTKSRK